MVSAVEASLLLRNGTLVFRVPRLERTDPDQVFTQICPERMIDVEGEALVGFWKVEYNLEDGMILWEGSGVS